jgi:hypothetical protein
MQTFQVDFNDLTESDQIAALRRLASHPGKTPHVGEHVALRDSEGNRCRARIARIDDTLVYAVPDWDTWSPAEDLLRRIQNIGLAPWRWVYRHAYSSR